MKVVILSLLATGLMQIGYFLWKLSADQLPVIGKAPLKDVLKGFLSSGKWLLGLACSIGGWVLFVMATQIGDISLVQPLLSVGDLFLVLLAVVFLQERLSKQEWFGLFLIVLGAVGLSWGAEISVSGTYSGLRTLIFFAGSFTALVLVLSLGKKSFQPEISLGIAVGICFGAGAIITKMITTDIAIHDAGAFMNWGLMIFLTIFMVACNVLGLTLLQMAFQKGRASVIVPVQLSVVNALAVLGGTLIFAELISVQRSIGIILIVAGTAVLQRSK